MKSAILLFLACATLASALPKGEISPSIVGGVEAKPHSAPHQVSIQVHSNGVWYHLCGGSIISADRIVTTATCIVGQDLASLRVVAGAHDLNVPEGTEQAVTVSGAEYHAYFLADTRDFDYGILNTTKPLTLNANVKAIALPPNRDYEASGECTTTGWGLTVSDDPGTMAAKLQQATVPIITREECTTLYNGVGAITPRMVCTNNPGKGPCEGDIGGPLVCNGVLAGTVSWGKSPCGSAQHPSVYSNIAPALGWYQARM